MGVAEILTLGLAAYGAALSTFLGFLAFRRDRHRVRLFPRLWASDQRPRELVIFVANVGLRPVTLTEAYFEFSAGEGGYSPFLDSELGLPAKLEDGEQIDLRFPLDGVDPQVEGLVILDTHRREHRLKFEASFREQMRVFRALGAESAAPGSQGGRGGSTSP